MTGRLEGKVAIITGAGSVGPGWGNGRATAVTFAREGAHVLLVDRDKESLEKTFEQVRELGGSATLRLADVTDQQAVEAFVGACVEEHGGLDILVNNVGGSRAGGVAELGIDDWHAQLEVNLTSVFLGCKAAVPVMRSGGGGSIVNISSASGLRYTGAAQVAYARRRRPSSSSPGSPPSSTRRSECG